MDRSELTPEVCEMIDRSTAAAREAYAPYSRFGVGAALLLESGEVVVGSNQENAAYPSGMCAERVALYSAGALYPHAVPKLLVLTAIQFDELLEEPPLPCGGCLQVMMEAERRWGVAIPIYCVSRQTVWCFSGVAQLLPFSFHLPVGE